MVPFQVVKSLPSWQQIEAGASLATGLLNLELQGVGCGSSVKEELWRPDKMQSDKPGAPVMQTPVAP